MVSWILELNNADYFVLFMQIKSVDRVFDIIATKEMKFGSKTGWKSIIPLRSKGKSAMRFCLFSKAKSSGFDAGKTPVYLNVYDLTPMNGYLYWAGLGIFHSGVEGKNLFFCRCFHFTFNSHVCH